MTTKIIDSDSELPSSRHASRRPTTSKIKNRQSTSSSRSATTKTPNHFSKTMLATQSTTPLYSSGMIYCFISEYM